MNIKLNNKEILFYIGIMTVLAFIWYSSKISLRFIFPFLIFCIIFYYFEMKKLKTSNESTDKINEIKTNLFDKEYNHMNDDDIILFIDSLKEIREYNIPVFNYFLRMLDMYFKDRTIERLIIVMETYESLYYSIPVELTYLFTEKQKKLKEILKDHLIEDTRKKVEMQSFIPATYTSKNYIHDDS